PGPDGASPPADLRPGRDLPAGAAAALRARPRHLLLLLAPDGDRRVRLGFRLRLPRPDRWLAAHAPTGGLCAQGPAPGACGGGMARAPRARLGQGQLAPAQPDPPPPGVRWPAVGDARRRR